MDFLTISGWALLCLLYVLCGFGIGIMSLACKNRKDWDYDTLPNYLECAVKIFLFPYLTILNKRPKQITSLGQRNACLLVNILFWPLRFVYFVVAIAAFLIIGLAVGCLIIIVSALVVSFVIVTEGIGGLDPLKV